MAMFWMAVPGALATIVYGAVGDSRGAQARGTTLLAAVAVPARGAARVPRIGREEARTAVKCMVSVVKVSVWLEVARSVINGDCNRWRLDWRLM